MGRVMSKIYIAGPSGMVGSALVRRFRAVGQVNLIFKTYEQLDLTRQSDVEKFFTRERPDYVILAAAYIGGVDFHSAHKIRNLSGDPLIELNAIRAAYEYVVKKLFFVGSTSSYSETACVLFREIDLFQDEPDSSVIGYGSAKRPGLICYSLITHETRRSFISAISTNLYGLNDQYNPQKSYVICMMIQRVHEAIRNDTDSVTFWGKLSTTRDFLFGYDFADAYLYLLEHCNSESPIIVGTGRETMIQDLTEIISEVVSFKEDITFDSSRPMENSRISVDSTKINDLGWKVTTSLKGDFMKTNEDYFATPYIASCHKIASEGDMLHALKRESVDDSSTSDKLACYWQAEIPLVSTSSLKKVACYDYL